MSHHAIAFAIPVAISAFTAVAMSLFAIYHDHTHRPDPGVWRTKTPLGGGRRVRLETARQDD